MAHVAKYARSATGHLLKHYERAKDEKGEYINFGSEDIDTSKTYLNYNLAPNKNQLEFLQERCSEVQCLKRKDVNVMCSWVVTKPKDLSEDLQEQFFKETYNFLENRYGKENVISSYVHLDEVTPHMHYVFVPVTLDKKKNIKKVSAKEVITKKDLQTFHNDLEKHLERELGYNARILNEATKEGNKSIQELKRGSAIQKLQEVNRELLEAQQDILPLKDERKALEGDIEHMKSMRGSVVNGVKENKSIFGKIKTVTMPKETYDACCSAQMRADSAEMKANRVQWELENIKASTSYTRSKELEELVKELKTKNLELRSSLNSANRKIDKLNKVFEKNPSLADEVLKAQKELNKNISRNNDLNR